MTNLNTFLKKEYIKLLKKLKTINIDCFFCHEKNVESFFSFSKCKNCQFNSFTNNNMDFFIEKLNSINRLFSILKKGGRSTWKLNLIFF